MGSGKPWSFKFITLKCSILNNGAKAFETFHFVTTRIELIFCFKGCTRYLLCPTYREKFLSHRYYM